MSSKDEDDVKRLEALTEELTIINESILERSDDRSKKLHRLNSLVDGCYPRSGFLYRELSIEETGILKKWATNNWKPNAQPNPFWHPAVLAEWNKLDQSHK